MYTVSPAVQDTVRCFFHKKAHLRYRTSCLRHGFRYKRSGGGIRARKGFRDAAFRIQSRIPLRSMLRKIVLPQQNGSAAKRPGGAPATAAGNSRILYKAEFDPARLSFAGLRAPTGSAFRTGGVSPGGTMASRIIKRFIIIENHNSKGGASWNMLLAPSLP